MRCRGTSGASSSTSCFSPLGGTGYLTTHVCTFHSTAALLPPSTARPQGMHPLTPSHAQHWNRPYRIPPPLSAGRVSPESCSCSLQRIHSATVPQCHSANLPAFLFLDSEFSSPCFSALPSGWRYKIFETRVPRANTTKKIILLRFLGHSIACSDNKEEPEIEIIEGGKNKAT